MSETPIICSEIAMICIEIVARRAKADLLAPLLAELPGDCLRLAPDRWLLAMPASSAAAGIAEIGALMAGAAFIIDQSAGYSVFALSGARARDTLAKGCRLDLHPRVFKEGDATRTLIAQVPVIVHLKDAAPFFHLFVPRTLARSFAHHLTASAEEYGSLSQSGGKGRSS